MTENKQSILKSILVSAKVRMIVTLVAVGLVAGVGVVVWHYHKKAEADQGYASISGGPALKDLPGAGNPSNQYVATQNFQNQQNAQKARKDAGSSVPTLTRPSFIGNPDSFGQLPSDGNAAADKSCPIKKVVVMYKPNPANCTVDNLRLAHQAGVTAEELRCQGCSCPAMKLAGYTAGELKNVGYTATELRHCGFSLQQLINAGFSAGDLRDAGFTAAQLKAAGFTAGQLAAAGFNQKQLVAAGYTPEQLAAAGINTHNCSVARLRKQRAAGVSAATLRRQGCGLAALKAAGFNAAELKAAGFTAGELHAAGFTDDQLRAAGFTPEQIRKAHDLDKICSVARLRKERLAGVSAVELRKQGCGLAALKAAGFSAAELKAAGFSAKQLRDAGFTAAQLKAAGFTAAQLKAAGFSAKQLHDAGFSAAQLKAAGFSAKQLKDAGFSAADLKQAGFSAADLKSAGFSAGQLNAAGFTAAQLKAAGFSAKQLRDAGYSAAALKQAGYSADALRHAGYTKGDLLRAGFSPKAAGYKPQEVTQAQPIAPNYAATTNTPESTSAGQIPSIMKNTPETRLAEIERAQQQAMSDEQRMDAIAQAQQAMTSQAQKLLNGWSQATPQTVKVAIQQKPQVAAGAGADANSAGGSSAGDKAADKGPVIKAGSIMFAVLDTSINSDENTPILATVVSGPLKGAKLLGNFQRVNKRIELRFDLLNVPSLAQSLTVNAVAIDPDTARTAISGQVNNHYLLRYGSLFASAFLEGFSNALLHQNTVSNCGPFGCVISNPKLTTQQQALAGLGKVGQRYSDVMGQNFNVPPTVKVPGGVGIGILYMQDLQLPQQLSKTMHAN